MIEWARENGARHDLRHSTWNRMKWNAIKNEATKRHTKWHQTVVRPKVQFEFSVAAAAQCDTVPVELLHVPVFLEQRSRGALLWFIDTNSELKLPTSLSPWASTVTTTTTTPSSPALGNLRVPVKCVQRPGRTEEEEREELDSVVVLCVQTVGGKRKKRTNCSDCMHGTTKCGTVCLSVWQSKLLSQ